MKKQSIGFVAVFMSMVLILAACGGNKTAEPATQPAASSAAPSAPAAEAQSYSFRLGHEVQNTHTKHLVSVKFKEELESATGGRMKVEIYPGAQLGKEKEMVQQVQTGTLDFAIISNGYMASQSESLNGWFLPFLFKELKSAAEARKTDAAKQMLKDLESQGLIGLDLLFAGNRHLLLKSGTLQTMDDIKGKKIRTPASPLFEEFWKSAGAGPTAVPLPEVYMALQTGVIDGVDIDLNALQSQKFYENAKHLTLTNHMTFPEIAIASKAVFDKLSAEDQQIVRDAMTRAVEWGVSEAIQAETKILEELKAAGVNIAEFTFTDEFKAITDAMHAKYAEKNAVIKAFVEQVKS